MKKIGIGILSLLLLSMPSFAQIGSGGIPAGFQIRSLNDYVPQLSFPLPDWSAALKQREKENAAGINNPYLIGLFVNHTDISFPESGSWHTLANGEKIWRTQVKISGAPAIGFYFDRFFLPQGVKMYLTNQNRKQILGAYTHHNNSDDDLFATEAVQGQLANIELDISPNVDVNAIKLHINRALVYFRSISYLQAFVDSKATDKLVPLGGQPDPYGFQGNSSICEINAICPQGADYWKQRKATVQIIVPVGNNQAEVCSATMINNTGNTPSNCKQYLLTATHCEGSNSTSNTPFSQILIRFNFETPDCVGGPAATVNTMVGAHFRARSNYVPSNPPHINGDFLLMELDHMIPTSWDVYLAGWDRRPNIPTTETAPRKFIDFSHPSGDVKKLAFSQQIDPNGDAGGSDGPGTHWQTSFSAGGIEQGSSGSGLFDGDGRLIGIASVGGNPNSSCDINDKGQLTQFLKYAAYSKLSYDWNYSHDGTSAMRRLRPWLDPGNTGALTTNAVKSNCEVDSNSTGIQLMPINNLAQSVAIFPNPSHDGMVQAVFNFEHPTKLKIEVYSMVGVLERTYFLENIQKKQYLMDLSHLADGMYMIRFDDGGRTAIKKLMLVK